MKVEIYIPEIKQNERKFELPGFYFYKGTPYNIYLLTNKSGSCFSGIYVRDNPYFSAAFDGDESQWTKVPTGTEIKITI